MTISYTALLGLAQPVTGTETGQWGTVVNDEITALLEDAVANAASISVTAGNVTLSTTNGSSNQARMSTLIITGTPGTTRNVVAPSQAKIYVVINQSDGAVVIKGAATSGVTIGAGQTAQVAWNGSDFVEIGNYVHGNFVVNGNLSVNGDSTLGNAGADTTTINGQVIAANSNISKTTTLSASAPALAWIKGATYTDTGTAGGTTQALAPFTVFSTPTLSTSNIVTYTDAATVYIAGAPAAAGSATITNPYSLYVAAGNAYFGASVSATTLDLTNLEVTNIKAKDGTASMTLADSTGVVTFSANPVLNAGTANGVPYLNGSKVLTTGSALTFDGANFNVVRAAATDQYMSLYADGTGPTLKFFGGAAGKIAGIMADSASASMYFTNEGNKPFVYAINGSEVMRLTSTGLKSNIAGTNADPVFSYTSDTNTGIFFPAADKLGFTAGGGSDQMVLTTTGLGIGTNNPAYKLHVVNDTAATNTAVDVLALTQSSTGTADSGLGAGILFNSERPLGGAIIKRGAIYGVAGTDPDDDGALTFYTLSDTGPSGFTEKMRLDASGNLGLGVTPSAWSNIFKAMQIGSASYLSVAAQTTATARGSILWNAIGSGDESFVYSKTGDPANRFMVGSGFFAWYTAGNGTAGDPISFNQAMTLDANGDLGVGTTSIPSGGASTRNVSIHNSNSAATYFKLSNGATGNTASDGFDLVMGTSSDAYIFNRENGPMLFGTNSTERARITSGGYFKASNNGTYADSTGGYHEFYQTNNTDTVRVTSTSTAVSGAYGVYVDLTTDPNATDSFFLRCYGGANQRASIRSNGGLANYQANDVNLSDQRVKKDIVAAPSYWDKIKGIEIVHFKYKDQTHDDNNVGVIAQQVEQVAPEFVDQNGWGDTPEDGVPLKSIYTSDMYHAAIKALQEAMARIEKLEAEVAALKGA